MSEKLVLIDGHSILNRAFFGIPDLTNAEGLHTNAVYGFLNILFKILEEEKPSYLAVAFDVHAPTFRHQMFEGYKGTRKPMAEELRQQVPLIKEMLAAMGVETVEFAGYEADDLLGTLSVQAEQQGLEVSIVSGDRDLLQLATDKVQIRIPKTKKTGTEIENYYAADVREAYKVSPKAFIDVKALMGDTSDNIPGVPGIGEKTATTLIETYGSIEAVHENAATVKPPRAAKNIVEFWEQALLSKTLATINTETPIQLSLEKTHMDGIASLYTQEAYRMCKRLEFKNFLSRFEPADVKPEVNLQVFAIETKKEAEGIFQKAKGKSLSLHFVPRALETKKNTHMEKDGQMSMFAVEQVENRYAALVLSFEKETAYVCLTNDDLRSEFLDEKVRLCIQEIWKHAERKEKLWIISENSKELLRWLEDWVAVEQFPNMDAYLRARTCFFDTGVAAYLLNPLKGEYPYEDVAKDHLDLMLPSTVDLIGKQTLGQALAENPEKAMQACGYPAQVAFLAQQVLEQKLKEQEMWKLYEEIEMPLVFVLSDMEKEGICLNKEELSAYGQKLQTSIQALEENIYEQAGEQFNINSPKQLGVILFEKLGMPVEKKTKTGYSTSAEVLEKLKEKHPIVADILEYRQLTKLKSTYADGLLQVVKEDGRIHTTFHQTITATGRLSSTDPNLQNIPIRMELGRLIRKVFYPKAGSLFVDSDYSQIELRVLAHMSGDEQLIEAFCNKQDIHRTTASQVFHVPFEEVTDLQRRNAKAVNFGIVYGISAFGLSQDLNIERKEAQEYIDRYFETYPKIKEFLDETVEQAKKTGQIRTLFGRIRPVPELSSSNYMQRQFGERIAMNSPIQGTAADIIKIAMIRVHDRLYAEGLSSRLLLQVHDELLIETKEEEKEKVIQLLEEEMHRAADLSVDMEVGTECGYTWYDAH